MSVCLLCLRVACTMYMAIKMPAVCLSVCLSICLCSAIESLCTCVNANGVMLLVSYVCTSLIRSISQSIRKIFNVSRITNVIARSTET